MIVIPGQPRLAQRRLRPLRGALRHAQLGAAPERRHDRRRRLDRAGPRQRADRPRPLRLDRGAVRGAGRPARSSSSTITCCPCPAPAASGTSSTTRATRSSASSGRASTSCSRGHKHVPYAWRLEDLFVVNAGTVSSSRLRGNGRPCYNIVEVAGHARRRLAEVPIPRPGAHHPVLDGDEDVREVHRANRRGGDVEPVKAVAIVDGEHYPDVVREALARAAVRVRRRDAGRRHREAARRAGLRRADRRGARATRRSSSTSPTSRC